ncbi:MAG: sigma-54 interaction domain-containing protein [Candidatus Binatia bacterium]
MTAYQVLLVHSPGTSPVAIQKVLEERSFLIHLGRSWEEAERIVTHIPKDQLKYVFIDLTLCTGSIWEQFVRNIHASVPEAVFIHFHPRNPHGLAYLLNRQAGGEGESTTNGGEQHAVVVGDSGRFREVLSLVHRYAPYDITVLITGETGTGKEVMARYIHEHSARKDGPLVACNMTAIPETLVESELFGYVRGAFTGAEKNKKGLIEAAEGGTLFLDEIGDLPLTIQLKLLRFLESREFYRVGESTPKTADVRIIAATNKPMEKAIQEQRFREDLYYRLNSARVILPPLRERREDILPLVEHFTAQSCREMQKPAKKISQSAQALLLDYSWPGNVREVKNVVESAVLVSDSEYLTIGDLPMHLQQYATGNREELSAKVVGRIDEAEREVIRAALREAGGDKTVAAKRLGISVRTLYRKLEKFSEFKDIKGEAASTVS